MKGWLGILSAGLVATTVFTGVGCGSAVTSGDGDGGEGGKTSTSTATGTGTNTGTATNTGTGTSTDTGTGTSTGTGTNTGTNTGTSTGTTTATVTGPTFKEVYEGILVPRTCTSAYCHGSYGGGALNDMHATYVGITNLVADGPGCGNTKVVVPGDADHSMLYLKVALPVPPCGKRMPADALALTTPEIELIRDWINAGALE